jgi:hypothetical protein
MSLRNDSTPVWWLSDAPFAGVIKACPVIDFAAEYLNAISVANFVHMVPETGNGIPDRAPSTDDFPLLVSPHTTI